MKQPNRRGVLYDRDRLMNAARKGVATTCVQVFNAIQGLRKEDQILGLAAAFLLTATASGIPAQDAFTAVKNLMHDPMTSSGLEARFQAMRFHLNTEVLEDA